MAKTTRTENLVAALQRLSKRERTMVAGASSMFLLFIAVMVGWWISSGLGSLEQRIETKTKRLQTLIDLRQQFEDAKRQIKESERIIRQGRNIQLMGTVEEFATKLGVAVEDMQPRTPALNAEANLAEEKVEVNIRTITVDRLVDFLRQIEQRSPTIAVRKLHVKQSFQQPDQLEVNLTVSNYRLIDENKAAAEKESPAAPEPKTRPSTSRPTKG